MHMKNVFNYITIKNIIHIKHKDSLINNFSQ